MVHAVIQARMGSSRLPGKVLKPVLGLPLLGYMAKRLANSKRLSGIIVASSSNQKDAAIERFCQENELKFFKGAEEDVLERFHAVAEFFDLKNIVRLTGDCPLIDPAVVDRVVDFFEEKSNCDYASNVRPRTFPIGMDVEIFTRGALKRAFEMAKDSTEREHVTPYFFHNEGIFKCAYLQNPVNLSQYRLTVDTPEDFALISAIIEHFGEEASSVSMEQMINYLKENPELLKMNENVIHRHIV